MDPSVYFRILGLKAGASIVDIKKAYRKKARQYHPDLNKSPGATDQFIKITEAYEFLLDFNEKTGSGDNDQSEFLEEWARYRQNIARQRAQAYTRVKYKRFVDSNLYKTTIMLDKSILFIGLIISIGVISCSFYGYIWRLRRVAEGYDPPTLGGFIVLLLTGLLFLAFTLMYLIAFYQTQKKKQRYAKKNKKPI